MNEKPSKLIEEIDDYIMLNKHLQGVDKHAYDLGDKLQQKILLLSKFFNFQSYINTAVEEGFLDPKLSEIFDLDVLAEAPQMNESWSQLKYLGVKNLADRYILKNHDMEIYETIPFMFMRIAMGLAIEEQNPTERALEFYNLYRSLNFMSSTPTLFNSGTTHAQLSSCFLTTIPDSLRGIYEGITEDAMLSKYAGGIGNDWSRVRGLGSYIKGTNGMSQGVIPFLKVTNDTAIACNQGGRFCHVA